MRGLFEIFAVRWEKSVSERSKWSTRTGFLIMHLEPPKDVATKRAEDVSGTWLYHAKFQTPISCTAAKRFVCPGQKRNTA